MHSKANKSNDPALNHGEPVPSTSAGQKRKRASRQRRKRTDDSDDESKEEFKKNKVKEVLQKHSRFVPVTLIFGK